MTLCRYRTEATNGKRLLGNRLLEFTALTAVLIASTGIQGGRTATALAAPGAIMVSGWTPFTDCPMRYVYGEPPRFAMEPRIAANPATIGTAHVNLVGVWIQDTWMGVVAGVSHDGGASWRRTPLPFTACVARSLEYQTVADPWVSVGSDGTVYVVATGHNPMSTSPHDAVLAATSDNGGSIWNNAHIVFRAQTWNDHVERTTVTADSLLPGVAYLLWSVRVVNRGLPTSQEWLSRTANGGRTWSKAQRLGVRDEQGQLILQHQIVISQLTKKVFDVFTVAHERLHIRQLHKCERTHRSVCRQVTRRTEMPVYEAELLSRWSNNSGDTWSDPVPVAHWQTTGLLPEFNDEPRAAGGIPDVAIDERTGRLYVVWQDSHLTNGASNDILLASSSDEGAHWSTRTRVSNGAESFDPNVSVSRGGVVGITYFSVQRSPTDRQEQQAADYNVAFSTSEGETFDKEVRIASTKASSMPSRYWTRDYFGLAVVGKEFHPFFVMPVSGDGENLTEVFTTSMAP